MHFRKIKLTSSPPCRPETPTTTAHWARGTGPASVLSVGDADAEPVDGRALGETWGPGDAESSSGTSWMEI